MKWINLKYRFVLILLITFQFLQAKEGLWIPAFIPDSVLLEMIEMGAVFNHNNIYDEDSISFKDAVVRFGGGCTGSFISSNGLVLTNHHCGLKLIQDVSTPENDYLTNGFWATSYDDEIPCKGGAVRVVTKTQDVTGLVLSGLDTVNDIAQKEFLISNRIDSLESLNKRPNVEVKVSSFAYDTRFLLYEYTVFTDIRLVGAAPIDIAKFGGETDNWKWPRHNADFSLFRVYADSNNTAADYVESNKPYHPKTKFDISVKGYREGDFTFVMGFPGRTREYLTSSGLNDVYSRLPDLIELRKLRLRVIDKFEQTDTTVFLKYASKRARISNAMKKWEGVVLSIERINGIEFRKKQEELYVSYVDSVDDYRKIINLLDQHYSDYNMFKQVWDYWNEAILANESMSLAARVQNLIFSFENDSVDKFQQKKQSFKRYLDAYYKNYVQEIDRETMALLFEKYSSNIVEVYKPTILADIRDKYDNDFNAYFKKLYKKSYLPDSSRMYSKLNKFNKRAVKKLQRDKLFQVYGDFADVFYSIYPVIVSAKDEQTDFYKKYYSIISNTGVRRFYPDANSTLRFSFGRVEGYSPRDAVEYNYFTTLDGLISKNDIDNPDFTVPEKLHKLYEQKEFMDYAEDLKLHTAFIASNHTSGGNSGSPVLNKYGQIIGVNFDRNWEGTISDYLYNEEYCRNISVDIRYILFIIDKYGGAKYLFNEMNLIGW